MTGAREALYERVAAFCADAVRTAPRTPVVVGVSGPQGCGKSTLAAEVVTRLGASGVRAVAISVDDFYLTHAEQGALAAAHPGNPFLEHRGYPGSHDVPLGASVLDALASRAPGDVPVPVYDKGAHGGRGDRAGTRTVRTPLDVVLLEGWMLGLRAVAPETVDDPHLRATNELLRAYDVWHARLGAFVHLDAVDPASVVRWRVDAERARRSATGAGLSGEEARDYVERFLPAYRTYVPGLRAAPPIAGPCLRVRIAEDRTRAPD
jgi:D-glycerate 3-kinase